VGKVAYQSPQVYSRASPPCDPLAADVWAVGRCAMILLLGHPGFEKPCTSDDVFRSMSTHSITKCLRAWRWADGISDEALAFMEAACALNPDHRPTVDELLAHPWLVGLTTPAAAAADVAPAAAASHPPPAIADAALAAAADKAVPPFSEAHADAPGCDDGNLGDDATRPTAASGPDKEVAVDGASAPCPHTPLACVGGFQLTPAASTSPPREFGASASASGGERQSAGAAIEAAGREGSV
jgi:hypothetical protein